MSNKNLDDLIIFETEGNNLDFKRIQYIKKGEEAYTDFLIDILAFANSDTCDTRYIIIGISNSNNQKDYLGIKDGFVDSATYQQLVRENIEPDLDIKYYHYPFKDVVLGVFEILPPNDKPYMLKKDYAKLKKGDSFIRKGTHNTKMLRKDFDKIYNEKLNNPNFHDKVTAFFTIDDAQCKKNEEINLPILSTYYVAPSSSEIERIKSILHARKSQEEIKDIRDAISRVTSFDYIFGYGSKSNDDLEKYIIKIPEEFNGDDNYDLYELNSHKINIMLENNADRYIESAELILTIPNIPGLLIANEIFEKPEPKNPLFKRHVIGLKLFTDKNYPSVEIKDGHYVISTYIKEIKHCKPIAVFPEPLRIILRDETIGDVINCSLKILGKNLKAPIIKNLSIIPMPNSDLS